jgi:hypothetical protein
LDRVQPYRRAKQRRETQRQEGVAGQLEAAAGDQLRPCHPAANEGHQVVGADERERLTQTLAAWLDHQRQTPQIAEALHVHPQTVRYRIAKLRQLLGDAIDDPGGRFDLQLALRIRSRRYRRTGDT